MGLCKYLLIKADTERMVLKSNTLYQNIWGGQRLRLRKGQGKGWGRFSEATILRGRAKASQSDRGVCAKSKAGIQ